MVILLFLTDFLLQVRNEIDVLRESQLEKELELKEVATRRRMQELKQQLLMRPTTRSSSRNTLPSPSPASVLTDLQQSNPVSPVSGATSKSATLKSYNTMQSSPKLSSFPSESSLKTHNALCSSSKSPFQEATSTSRYPLKSPNTLQSSQNSPHLETTPKSPRAGLKSPNMPQPSQNSPHPQATPKSRREDLKSPQDLSERRYSSLSSPTTGKIDGRKILSPSTGGVIGARDEKEYSSLPSTASTEESRQLSHRQRSSPSTLPQKIVGEKECLPFKGSSFGPNSLNKSNPGKIVFCSMKQNPSHPTGLVAKSGSTPSSTSGERKLLGGGFSKVGVVGGGRERAVAVRDVARERRDRVLKIRRCVAAATTIQRAWRRHRRTRHMTLT